MESKLSRCSLQLGEKLPVTELDESVERIADLVEVDEVDAGSLGRGDRIENRIEVRADRHFRVLDVLGFDQLCRLFDVLHGGQVRGELSW